MATLVGRTFPAPKKLVENNKQPSKEQLIESAKELGLNVSNRTSKQELLDKIAAAKE